MPLPLVTAPPEAPEFLANGFSAGDDPVFSDVPVGTGHARRRRVYTLPLRTVRLRWLLEAGALAAVEDWYENALQAGALSWAARIADPSSPSLLWCEARWISFSIEMLHYGRGVLSGELLLIGDPTPTAPASYLLELSVSAALRGMPSTLSPPWSPAIDFAASLDSVRPWELTFVAELLSYGVGALLLEDGDYLLTEAGDRILL